MPAASDWASVISKVVDDSVGASLAVSSASDADVGDDYELQGFVNELGANDGGRLRGIPEVKRRAALKALVSRFIYIAGPVKPVQANTACLAQLLLKKCIATVVGEIDVLIAVVVVVNKYDAVRNAAWIINAQ